MASLETVLRDFDASWSYTSGSWHERWNDNYHLYNNQRVKVGYEGITDTFVPMIFSTVETMTSALFGNKPRFDYIPPSDKENQSTEVLNALMDYYWDKDRWSIKFINWGRDFIRLGTSVIYVYWDECPRIINVPIRDFFIDPTATSLENAAYMGRRYLTTLEDLKSFEVVDLEKSTEEETVYKPKYKNLNKIKEARSGKGENTDKEEKDIFYGSTVDDANKKQIEVIEWWGVDEKGNDKVISIANRSTIIEDEENYFKSKARDNGEEYPSAISPFVALRNYVDGSLFYAKGDVDFLSDQQELLNDLTNQNIDAITYTLNQMYTLDPTYAHLVEEIENIPGAVYPVEAGALNPIPMGNVPQDAFTERINLKDEMRETSSANEIIKGVPQEGGKVTATEINAQIAGAGQRIGLKVTQIEDEGFYRLADIVFRMIKLYVTEPMMVRVLGRDGANWEQFDPEEFTGDYQPRVKLESTVNSEKFAQADNAKELYAAFLDDPEVNQIELKKLVLQRGFDLDPDEVKLLTEQPELEELEGQPDLLNEPIEEPTPEELAMLEAMIDPLTGELIPQEQNVQPEFI